MMVVCCGIIAVVIGWLTDCRIFGFTDHAFAGKFLLGFRFIPRIRNLRALIELLSETGQVVENILSPARLPVLIRHQRVERDTAVQRGDLRILTDARRKLALWRQDYNNVRAHSSLGNKTPTEARWALDLLDANAPGALVRPETDVYQSRRSPL